MYIYLLRCEEHSYYKIGITNNLQKRLKEIQTGTPDKIYFVDFYESKYARKIESGLHRFFEHKHRNNEWFELSLEDEVKFKSMCVLIENNLKFIESSQNEDIL